MSKRYLMFAAASLLATSAMAEVFPLDTVLSGFKVEEGACKANAGAVWVVVDGQGDCVRFYAAGLHEGKNSAAVFYLHGDRLWGDKPISYEDNDSDKQQAKVEAIHKEIGQPFIMIARPGLYGSSGSHAHRREMRELELADEAIAEIRKRYQIERTALTGQSGGGAIAAYVLTKQPDLSCVVLTSSALSMRTILKADPKSIYDTSHPGLYNAIEHVSEIKPNASRRIFVIGMEGDKFSPFANQREYADALNAKGVEVELLHGEATGSFGHTLDQTGRTVASWCLSGISNEEIGARVRDRQVKG